jgi:hypothetical protein
VKRRRLRLSPSDLSPTEQGLLTDFFRDFVLMHRPLDAETLWQIARAFAYFGEQARALALFGLSLERGFVVYRILTREDPWLDALRSSPEFGELLQRAELRYRAASAAFREAGGEQLPGVRLPGPAASRPA